MMMFNQFSLIQIWCTITINHYQWWARRLTGYQPALVWRRWRLQAIWEDKQRWNLTRLLIPCYRACTTLKSWGLLSEDCLSSATSHVLCGL